MYTGLFMDQALCSSVIILALEVNEEMKELLLLVLNPWALRGDELGAMHVYVVYM
jgi:hypothetical protein